MDPTPTTSASDGPAALPAPPLVVDVAWLQAHLDDPDLVVVDASIGTFRGHVPSVPGARPVDIDGELSDHTVDLPHTMPALDAVAAVLRRLGVSSTDHVVAYDAHGVYSSPRALWMLRALGHERVSVLDGGLPAWEVAGGPLAPVPAGYDGPPGDLQVRPRGRSSSTGGPWRKPCRAGSRPFSTPGAEGGSPELSLSRGQDCVQATCRVP